MAGLGALNANDPMVRHEYPHGVGHMHQTKAFILGLDGGTWDLLDPLIDAGELPGFAQLRQESASAFTSTTWPAHTGPGWATFVNACMPGQHGVFQFFHTQDPAYRGRIVGTREYGRHSCWQWAAARNLTLGLVNVPMSHPAVPLPGYQITWPLKQTTNYSNPQHLLADLAHNECYFRSDLATMYRGDLNYIDHALKFVPERMRAARYLLENWNADVFAIVLTEADRVCHHYWQFSDPTHPLYEPDAPLRYKEAIRIILRLIDQELSETLKLLPEDSSVIVVSDHGFGPGHRSLAANTILKNAGYLGLMSGSAGSADTASWFTEDGSTIDWEKTRAYMPVPGSYGLNVNLRGRQVNGTVDSQDYDRILNEVTEIFRPIRIPETGKPAFRSILRREEAYPGPMMEQAPDLLLIPADERLMVTPSFGQEWTWSYQTGLHRHEGMWMHRSPKIKSGRLSHRTRLIDVLPTLFEDMGFDTADAFQGQPISSVFSHQAARSSSEAWIPSGTAGSDVEEEFEAADLTERLKAMGYL
ncbi:MAG TPA: alkaline phosphatase family protein [Candidatus Polarisedimenticolia bacterium]|nr:alkaline phosphatase family protein [Candidatus Polarisedimenticolia bacterium]